MLNSTQSSNPSHNPKSIKDTNVDQGIENNGNQNDSKLANTSGIKNEPTNSDRTGSMKDEGSSYSSNKFAQGITN